MPSSSRSNSSVPSRRSIPNREDTNQRRKNSSRSRSFSPKGNNNMKVQRQRQRKNSSCSRSNKSVKSQGSNTNGRKKTVVNSSVGSRSRSKSPQGGQKRSCPNSSRSKSPPSVRQKVKKNSSSRSKSSKRSSRSKRSGGNSPPRNNFGNRDNNDGQFRGRGRGRGRGDRGRGRGGFNNNGERNFNNNGGGFNRDNNGYGNRQNNFNRNNYNNRDDNGYNNNDNRRNNFNNNNDRNNSYGNTSIGSNQRSPNLSNSFNSGNSPSNNCNHSPHSPLKIDQLKKTPQQIRLQEFYNNHKQDGWLREKFNPISLISQQNQRFLYIKKAQEEFLQQFNNGFYDQISLTIANHKALGNLEFEEQQDGEVDERKMTSIVTLYLNDSIKIQGPPFYGIEKDSSTLYIPDVPKEVYRYDIYEVVSEIDGFKNLILNEPQRKLDFKRMAWIEYQDQIKTSQALEKLKNIEIKSKKLEFTRACKRIRKAKTVINYPQSRIEQDLNSAVEIASKLDYEAKIYEKNPLYDHKFPNQLKKLEIFITYLRKVQFFDYFESKFYDSFRTLTIKSGMTVLLVQADPSVEIETEELKKLDVKNSIVKEKGSTEYRKKAIENVNIFTDLIKTNLYKIHQFQPDIQQPPKYWKCHECRKKFLTIVHLIKHTTSRHEDMIEKEVQQAMLSIFMKNEEEWEKNRNERETKEQREEKRRKVRRALKDFDCPEEEEDEELRQRLRPVSQTKKLINFLDI